MISLVFEDGCGHRLVFSNKHEIKNDCLHFTEDDYQRRMFLYKQLVHSKLPPHLCTLIFLQYLHAMIF